MPLPSLSFSLLSLIWDRFPSLDHRGTWTPLVWATFPCTGSSDEAATFPEHWDVVNMVLFTPKASSYKIFITLKVGYINSNWERRRNEAWRTGIGTSPEVSWVGICGASVWCQVCVGHSLGLTGLCLPAPVLCCAALGRHRRGSPSCLGPREQTQWVLIPISSAPRRQGVQWFTLQWVMGKRE